MFGVRLLLFTVAFLIVLGEMALGVMATQYLQKIVSIVIGGFVIALLLATSIYVLGRDEGGGGPASGGFVQWATLLIVGFGISAVAFYFPTFFLPALTGMELTPIAN